MEIAFHYTLQVHGHVVVKQVIPDSPVHVPVHAYPSPQTHIQPSAPGKMTFTCKQAFEKVLPSHLGQADFPAAKSRFHS